MQEKLIKIPIDSKNLEGILKTSETSKGLVIFVHGSGSSRLSPRNNYVAEVLNKANLSTLLFDLLTEKEDEDFNKRFDIDFLTNRLKFVTDWAVKNEETKNMKIGYFGASTGAAAALDAFKFFPKKIKAIVSRGGRVDLARDLIKVKTPTLFIVGQRDEDVLSLNEKAIKDINFEKKLEIIPKATHLFEETGALEKVAILASKWFEKFLI